MVIIGDHTLTFLCPWEIVEDEEGCRFVGHDSEVTITYQPPDYKKQLKEKRKKSKERKI